MNRPNISSFSNKVYLGGNDMAKNNHIHTVSMEENFEKLEKRLIDANQNIDLSSLKEIVDNVCGSAITIGCGGSLVVANYLSQILASRGVFSICRNSRDILYGCKADTLFAFSYSGKTHGIKLALDRFKGNKYLLTCNNELENDNNFKIISLRYSDMDKEKSFISLSSTLISMGEFLKINENFSSSYLKRMLEDAKNWASCQEIDKLSNLLGSSEVFEIMSGSDTSTPALFLESTLVEAGLGIPIIHDKYSYCHGRSTLAYKNNRKHNLIYLINEKTEIDDFLLSIIKNNYRQVIIIDATSNGSSLNKEYFLTLKSVFLCKKLAEIK